MAPAAFTVVLLGLWITSRAVRPSREDFAQLQETEVAPPDDRRIREAGAAFLQGGSDPAGYPHCDGLPGNGSHVIDRPLVIRTSCTWHGHPGLQVALKKPISFQGSLVLMGEIQITAVQELDGFHGLWEHDGDVRERQLRGLQKHVAGGCLRVFAYQQDVASSAVFEDCDVKQWNVWGAAVSSSSTGDGGCVYAGTKYGGSASMGSFTQGPNSSVHFRRCMAAKHGGCLQALRFQQDIGSAAVFEDCSANNMGGGAHVVENFTQRPSSFVHFRSCRATSRGGGLVVENYEQDGGSAVFENCSANDTKSEGGAVFVGNMYGNLGSFTQGSNSSVHFRSGRATERGGCLRALRYQQGVGSSAVFEHCIVDGGGESDIGGGGAFLSNNFTQGPNSSVHFRSCRSTKRGGGLIAANYQQDVSSSAVFEDCLAADDGGGAHVSSNFTQGPNSSAHFRRCRATKHGGGLSVAGYQQNAGSMAFFENCSADRGEGGGLQTRDLDANGSMHFKTCRAELGGGLMIAQCGAVHHRGSLVFEACNARNGGGLYSNAGQGHFANLRFDACDAEVVGAAFSAIADDGAAMEVRMEELWLLNAGRSNSKDFEVSGTLKLGSTHVGSESSFGVYISARDLLLEDVMNCTKTPTCTFFANTSRSAGFLCPLGTGVVDFDASEEFGCFACKPGSTQVQTTTNRSCSPCPDGALLCLAGELRMTRGLMVELENVSRSFHCPNEASCPGGHVAKGRVQVAMCEEGYRGQGCTSCSDGHAMADNSVFSCSACSQDRRMQVVQWITFLSQRSFLFALGAFSALGAKKAGDLKQSSIYLNQLMAFATISNTILAAILQTKTAKDIKSEAANFFFNAAAHTAEAASGQGSLRSASSQCLLSYVGYEKTLWGAHLLEVVVAAGLMSSLSFMKDFRVALIAGINCFLPAIAADFGKYLVCFRLQPSDGLHCPFIPGFPGLAGATQVAVGLTVFMVAALWTWLSLSRSEEDPPPSHVVFLTSKYQPRYALFETERLIRKTLFTFIGALLPISSSPALQMGCLGMVVWMSLFLYCLYQPYHTPEWNWIEICLLFVAMLMILSVSTLLANEFHWGHSVPTQQSIIFTTAAVAAVASAIMTFRVMQELVREHRQAAK
ncbi:pmpB [Symbiodinium sp. CCMP2592]|nr:pmpB [Symbiodinium sp. CCMP2592]